MFVSGSIISPAVYTGEDMQYEHFSRLAQGHADEWQIWQGTSSEAYCARCVYQRKRISVVTDEAS